MNYPRDAERSAEIPGRNVTLDNSEARLEQLKQPNVPEQTIKDLLDDVESK